MTLNSYRGRENMGRRSYQRPTERSVTGIQNPTSKRNQGKGLGGPCELNLKVIHETRFGTEGHSLAKDLLPAQHTLTEGDTSQELLLEIKLETRVEPSLSLLHFLSLHAQDS